MPDIFKTSLKLPRQQDESLRYMYTALKRRQYSFWQGHRFILLTPGSHVCSKLFKTILVINKKYKIITKSYTLMATRYFRCHWPLLAFAFCCVRTVRDFDRTKSKGTEEGATQCRAQQY